MVALNSDSEIGDVGDDDVSGSEMNLQWRRLTMSSLLSRLPLLSKLLVVLYVSAAMFAYIRDV